MKIYLPFECVCGNEENYEVEEGYARKDSVLTTSCSSCQATVFIKINQIFFETREIGYTVGIGTTDMES